MRQVTHALLTRPPLDRISASTNLLSFDLHVLSTPPAFILSQDQTLIKNLSRVQIWLWSLSIPFTVLGLYQTCVCYVQFEILYLEFQGCHVVNFSRFFAFSPLSDNFYMLSHLKFFVNNFFIFFQDLYSCWCPTSSATTSIYYHTEVCVSTTFSDYLSSCLSDMSDYISIKAVVCCLLSRQLL